MVKRHGPPFLAACVVLLLAGCETPAPTSDADPPEITVTVARGRGDNIFRSEDGELATPDDCIKVPGTPVELVLIVGDSGGVQTAAISAFLGVIDPDSVEVTPAEPESSYSIGADRGTETLEITLRPPTPDTVRTGATATLQVDGRLPVVIGAYARDQSGNTVELSPFELRTLDDAVICRGE